MKASASTVWLALLGMLVNHVCVAADASTSQSKSSIFIGTYTGAKSHGIYVADFDSAGGIISAPTLAAETSNPTFLALHPNGRFLYAANEIGDFGGKPAGAVSAFRIDQATHKLTLLNQQASGGAGPCHLSLDGKGNCLLVANYGSGSVAALPIDSDGRLREAASTIQHHGSSVNAQRQSGPHAHFITLDPAEKFALSCDLGLDKVFVYTLDRPKALLAYSDPPSASVLPGAGPRHLAFHPMGKFVYVVNEMGCSVDAFTYDPRTGTLSEQQTISTLPKNFKGNSSCAEVQVHPSGKFLYASNRGHDSIAVFSIDAQSGKLTVIEQVPTQGRTPRHFALDPTGKWLLAENQDSNSIVVFSVDSSTGRLNPTGNLVEVGAPVCVVFAGGRGPTE